MVVTRKWKYRASPAVVTVTFAITAQSQGPPSIELRSVHKSTAAPIDSSGPLSPLNPIDPSDRLARLRRYSLTKTQSDSFVQLSRRHYVRPSPIRQQQLAGGETSSRQVEYKSENAWESCVVKSSTVGDVGPLFAKFRGLEAKQTADGRDDVYAADYVPRKYSKDSAEYGTPKPGTLTEARAKKASKHVAKEMLILCEVIEEHGKPGADGRTEITFGKLFHVYTFISDKVVGMLLRARKHGMVAFDGEMLFQRQDDHKVITLLLSKEDIRQAKRALLASE